MKLYFLPLCVAAILWGCGHDKEKKREDSEAAKAEYVAERNVVDTVVLRPRNFNKQIVGNGKLRAVTKSFVSRRPEIFPKSALRTDSPCGRAR